VRRRKQAIPASPIPGSASTSVGPTSATQ
jgi:hypothetical protein